MEATMVTRDDRRAVALATRRSQSARYLVRRRVGLDFLPGPQPLEVDEPAPPPSPPRCARQRPDSAASNRPRPAAPKPRKGWRWAARLLVVALIAAMLAAGVFGRQWYDQRQLDTARQQALATARQVTVNFVSISAATVDRDLKRIADGATGEFKDEFTRGMAQVRAAVVENRVDSRGSVLRAAVVSADRRGAVVLVAVDATVKNTSTPAGRLSHYRIQVSLARDAGSGRWLVSQLQFVG
jgi:Mce-associated membrane protein